MIERGFLEAVFLLSALACAQSTNPYEKLTRFKEVHGFHIPEHRVQFYTKLLDFLDRSIGTSDLPTKTGA